MNPITLLRLETYLADDDHRPAYEKLLAAFSDVWSKMPEGDRRALLAHWATPCCAAHAPTPRIRVIEKFAVSDPRKRTLARCQREGKDLLFSAETCLRHPDLRHTMAHELGHARQFSLGTARTEEGADAWAARWGWPRAKI
jgi:hypothetical protein